MFLDASGHGKDVRIKYDVTWIRAYVFGQNPVRTRQDLHLPVYRRGLSFLVKSHYNNRRPVGFDQMGVFPELRFALFETDGVDDSLALDTLETGFYHRPFGTVDHDGHAGNIRFGGDVVQERGHGLSTI